MCRVLFYFSSPIKLKVVGKRNKNEGTLSKTSRRNLYSFLSIKFQFQCGLLSKGIKTEVGKFLSFCVWKRISNDKKDLAKAAFTRRYKTQKSGILAFLDVFLPLPKSTRLHSHYKLVFMVQNGVGWSETEKLQMFMMIQFGD